MSLRFDCRALTHLSHCLTCMYWQITSTIRRASMRIMGAESPSRAGPSDGGDMGLGVLPEDMEAGDRALEEKVVGSA
jgi:hypothetical protein